MGFLFKGVIQNMAPGVYERNEVVEDPREGFICEQELVEKAKSDPRYEPEEFQQFDLEMLFEVFIVLAGGSLVSMFGLFLERFAYHGNKIKSNITKPISSLYLIVVTKLKSKKQKIRIRKNKIKVISVRAAIKIKV